MVQPSISWKIRSFPCPKRPFSQEKGSYYGILAREITHKPPVLWQMQKRTWRFREANLATKPLKTCKEPSGGSCRCDLWLKAQVGSYNKFMYESRKLKWGDVKLQINGETGNEESVWTAERGSKCWNGKGPGRPILSHRTSQQPRTLPCFLLEAIIWERWIIQSSNKTQMKTKWCSMVYECSTWKEFYRKLPEDGNEKNGFVRECDKPRCQKM